MEPARKAPIDVFMVSSFSRRLAEASVVKLKVAQSTAVSEPKEEKVAVSKQASQQDS